MKTKLNIAHCLAVLTAAFTMSGATPSSHAVEPVKSVRIDGDINDAVWKKARKIEAFRTLDGKQPQASTIGLMLTDEHYLYLAFRCEEPLMNKLESKPLARDGSIWTNDCLEIFIAPFHRQDEYYQIAVDVAGQIYDAFKRAGKQNSHYDLSVTAKVQKQQNSWTCEIAVPLHEIGLTQTRAARMNFARERKAAKEETTWHGGFGKPDTWQPVKLALDERYHLDVLDWKFGGSSPQFGKNHLEVEFKSKLGASVQVLLQALENGQWKLKGRKTVTNSSGQIVRASLPYSITPQNKPQSLRYILKQGEQSIFSSTYRLNLPPDALVAVLASPYYYVEENAAFMQLDSFLSPESLQTSEIRLIVRTPGGKVSEIRNIRPARKSMLTGFDVSAWRHGIGSATAELITDGKLMAHRKIMVSKRSGPFSEKMLP